MHKINDLLYDKFNKEESDEEEEQKVEEKQFENK